MDPHTYSPVEALESRIAPATVTVDFTGGNLNLTSDDGAHIFFIDALDATTIQLKGGLDTVFQQGSDPTTDTLRLTGPIKSLTATLGSGSDNLVITGLNVARDINMNLGGGNNHVEIISLTTKGSLKIIGDAGTDSVILGNGNVVVRKDLSLQLGDNTNSLLVAAIPLQLGGQLTYTGGAGSDTARFASAEAVIGGNATFTFGAGNSELGLLDGSYKFGRDLIFDSTASLAAETAKLQISSSSVNVGRDLVFRDGAANSNITFNLIGSQLANRNFTVETGAGTYDATLLGTFGGRLLDFDASASSGGTLTYNGSPNKAGQILFTGGNGSDSFNVGGIHNKPLSITANLGDGNNDSAIQLSASTIKGITITGGDNEDEINVNLLSSKVAGSLNIDTGVGAAIANLKLQSTSVNSEIRVINGSGPGTGTLTIDALASKIAGISYTTNSASSSFSLAGSIDLAVKGAVRVTGSAGSDSVDLGVAGGRIGKGITLDLGDGSNSVGGSFSGLFTKSLVIIGGAGGDNLSLNGDGNLGVLKLDLGAGNNSALFVGVTGFVTAKTFTFSSATDVVDSDAFRLERVQVLGKFNAKFGSGASLVQLDDSIFGSVFTLDTGAGGDTVNIDTLGGNGDVVLNKSALLTLGDGSDILILGGNGTTQLLTAKSRFRADGGAGSDTLTNSPNNIFAKEPEFIGFE
jgi:hypothetical protein